MRGGDPVAATIVSMLGATAALITVSAAAVIISQVVCILFSMVTVPLASWYYFHEAKGFN